MQIAKRRVLPEFSVRMYLPSSVAMTREKERDSYKGKKRQWKRSRVEWTIGRQGGTRKRESESETRPLWSGNAPPSF